MNEAKPISEARSNAARESGKKSHGPVTPEGKEKSRMNALKFGFYSAKESSSPMTPAYNRSAPNKS